MEVFHKKEEVFSFCKDISAQFKKKQIVLLSGEVGVGKTYFTRSFCQVFGESFAQSPTYSLMNVYNLNNGQRLFHIDLYRMESLEDLESTGFWDLFSLEKAWVFIEWPEKLQIEDLPRDWSLSTLRIDDGDDVESRKYTYLKH